MARSPGSAVFDRELQELRVLSAMLGAYSGWASQAITEALRARTADVLDVLLSEQFDEMVIAPTVEALALEGYQDRAAFYLDKFNLLSDSLDVLKAMRDYAAAKKLSKRATRNLMREALAVDARVMERVPEELVTVGGKASEQAAKKFVHPNLPFVERGMTYRDRMATTARTLATGMEGWGARQQAARDQEDLRWVTMRDDKVRPAHVHAQGQTVPYDEPFYVGGYPMWFPGDPDAPDDLTVNCRCVLATVKAPERRWVQRYVPPAWLNAAATGGGPSQARAPKGTPIGGQWIDTPTAILRSLNRLGPGQDVAEGELPADFEAERMRLADEVLAREGRPGVQETADRVADIWDRTSPEEREAGAKWYGEAQDVARGMVDEGATELTEDQAAAIIAHLSTRTQWDVNVIAAQTLARGGTLEEANAAIKAAAEAGTIARGGGILTANWEKALRASVSPDPIGRDNLNLGTFSEASNKTRTFASNILGDTDGITVDTWMYRVLGQSDLVTGKIPGVPGRIRKDQVYEALAEAVRVAAKAKGVDPVDMQGATWLWALDNYKPSRGGNPGRFLDKDTGEEFPDMLAASMVEPESIHIDDGEVLDYFYHQAELAGIRPDPDAVIVRDDLTAALELSPPGTVLYPGQARAPRGTPIGGQWIDTPSGLARGLQEGTLWPEAGDDTGLYITPEFSVEERTTEQTQTVLDAGMPVPEQDKVIGYTGGAYALANDTLRGPGSNDTLPGMVDDNTLPREGWTKNGQTAEQIVADLDSQMSALPEDVMLYRNLNKQAAFGTDDPATLAGMVIQDKGFMSTSYDGERYRPLNEVGHPAAILRIRAPKGTRAIYAQPVSAFEQEAEILLDRGTRIAIIGYDPYTGIVDAIIVNDPVLTGSLTAALTSTAPSQARAPKGSPGGIGGEFIHTPGGLMERLKYGTDVTAPPPVDEPYFVPDAQAPADEFDNLAAVASMKDAREFSPEGREVLRRYSGTEATRTNNIIRTRGGDLSGLSGVERDRIGHIDEMIRSSPASQDIRTTRLVSNKVFRNMPGYPDSQGLVGQVIKDEAFLSTSIGGTFGDMERTGVEFIITVPKGSPALWVKPVSDWPGENELLLPRGTPLAITKVVNGGRTSIYATVATPAPAEGLTAAATQARAPKGTIIGGQWIDTPSGILNGLGWSGESPETPDQAYDVPTVNPEVSIPMRTLDPMERKTMIDDEAARLAATQPVITDTDQDIRFYTATGAMNLNINLRAGSRDPGDEEKIANLDAAIAQGFAPYDMYVYRAMPRKSLPHPGNNPFAGESADDPQALIGSVLADKAYLSTSIDSRGAGASSDTIMRIAIPKGHPILWAEPHSHNPGEYEVMLGRDTPLAITSIGSDPWGDPVYEAVIAYPSALAASAAQARAPKGTTIGGQWIDTPTGIMDNLEGADRRAAKRWDGKGEPLDFAAASADPALLQDRVNPGGVGLEDKTFLQNCTRVAFATEMQARGYPNAVAPPFHNDYPTFQPDLERKWLPTAEGGTRYFQNGGPGGDFSVITANDPPGSRYWVTASKQKGGAHVWNAEKQADGSLLHIDAQVGTGPMDFGKAPLVSILRVDDLEPTFAAVKGSNDTGEPAWAISRADLAAAQGVTASLTAAGPLPLVSGGWTDGTNVLLVPEPGFESYNDCVLILHPDGKVTEEYAGDGRFEGWMPVSQALTAAAPNQARAPKGTRIGGQWIPTPGAMLDRVKAQPIPGVQNIVREQGGASISPITGTQPTDGYMVAIQGYNREVPDAEFFGPGGEDRLYDWIEENQQVLGLQGSHIGLWHDTENGEVVFDVSQRVDDLDEAIRLGGERNQQAIWDVANGEEIGTGGTGDRQASAGPAPARGAPRRLRRLARGAQAGVRPRHDRGPGRAGLTFTPTQARAPKGTVIGGQWIDTPGGMLRDIRVGSTVLAEDDLISLDDMQNPPEQIDTDNLPVVFDPSARYGQPGPPQTYLDMAKGYTEVNPGSGLPGGDVNCQRTATAWEMRARGYDVVAAPASGVDGSSFNMEAMWETGEGQYGSFSMLPRSTTKEAVWGVGGEPGQRFIVIGYDPVTMAGHAWNAEVLADGTVFEWDPQNKDEMNPAYWGISKINVMRVDNLNPGPAMDWDDGYGKPPWVMPTREFGVKYADHLGDY